VNSSWIRRRLREVTTKIGSGATPLGGEAAYASSGISLVRSLNVHDSGFRTKDLAFLHDAQAAELDNVILEPGDVLLNITGASIARCCIVPEVVLPARVNQHVAILRTAKKQLLPELLHYMLISKDYKDRLLGAGEGGGSTRQALTKAQLQDFVVEFPESLPEQRRIVAILDEAFAGIATAKANAEQNLQNAQAVYESVIHSVKADKVPLGDLVNIKTGKLDANAAVEGGKYPFFTCSREVFAIDHFAFDCEAILLAGNNAVGDFNVKHHRGKFNAYQRTYVITVNDKSRVLYRFLYFEMLKSLKHFKEQSVGAGTKFLKLGMINDMRIALPSVPEQERLVKQIDAIMAETNRLAALYQRKLAALDELKKSLLHQAFSGAL
jgi:type I restriction enzyme S subunit